MKPDCATCKKYNGYYCFENGSTIINPTNTSCTSYEEKKKSLSDIDIDKINNVYSKINDMYFLAISIKKILETIETEKLTNKNGSNVNYSVAYISQIKIDIEALRKCLGDAK